MTDLIDAQPLVTDLEVPGLARIIPSNAVLETVSTGFVATEGPLWNRREEYLLWSDMAGDKIYQWKPGHGTSVFIDPSGHSNGLTYDLQGRLLVAGFGSRNIWRLESNGDKAVLATHYEGVRLQAPNDIVVKSDGSIYWTESTGAFTHPGLSGPGDEYDVQQYRDLKPILRLLPDGSGPTCMVDDFEGPNGIAFSPDESLLYINDIRRRHIRVFDVQQDGTLGTGRMFYEDQQKERGGPDGMKVDHRGQRLRAGLRWRPYHRPSGPASGANARSRDYQPGLGRGGLADPVHNRSPKHLSCSPQHSWCAGLVTY